MLKWLRSTRGHGGHRAGRILGWQGGEARAHHSRETKQAAVGVIVAQQGRGRSHRGLGNRTGRGQQGGACRAKTGAPRYRRIQAGAFLGGCVCRAWGHGVGRSAWLGSCQGCAGLHLGASFRSGLGVLEVAGGRWRASARHRCGSRLAGRLARGSAVLLARLHHAPLAPQLVVEARGAGGHGLAAPHLLLRSVAGRRARGVDAQLAAAPMHTAWRGGHPTRPARSPRPARRPPGPQRTLARSALTSARATTRSRASRASCWPGAPAARAPASGSATRSPASTGAPARLANTRPALVANSVGLREGSQRGGWGQGVGWCASGWGWRRAAASGKQCSGARRPALPRPDQRSRSSRAAHLGGSSPISPCSMLPKPPSQGLRGVWVVGG